MSGFRPSSRSPLRLLGGGGEGASSPQTIQNILDWLRNLFPQFGGDTEPINLAVDEASSIGNAITNCPGGLAQAARYYSNPAAPYDPYANPSGSGNATTPIDPDLTSWQSRFAQWFNDWQQRHY